MCEGELKYRKSMFLDITLCAYSDIMVTYVMGTGNIFRATAIHRQLNASSLLLNQRGAENVRKKRRILSPGAENET
jgi:hypothetical protein